MNEDDKLSTLAEQRAKQLRLRTIARMVTPILLALMMAMAGNILGWAADHRNVHMAVVGGVLLLCAVTLIILRWWEQRWI